MVERLTYRVAKSEAGQRLDDFLIAKLALEPLCPDQPISKAKLRAMVVAGAVHLSAKPVKSPAVVLALKAKVTVFVDWTALAKEKRPNDVAWELSDRDILFEDEVLLAINKPAGLASEGTIVASRDSVLAAVERFLARRDGAAEPYLRLAQRLDRETSGVLLLVKSPKAGKAIFDQFAGHTTVKVYRAICSLTMGVPPPHFTVANRLDRISAKSARAQWGAVAEGGYPAQTDFVVLATGRQACLIEARPRTGRTHQIRVHLAESGWPIVGDRLYGGPDRVAGQSIGRVMLHALALQITHPVSGRSLDFKAPEPADFQACQQALGI